MTDKEQLILAVYRVRPLQAAPTTIPLGARIVCILSIGLLIATAFALIDRFINW